MSDALLERLVTVLERLEAKLPAPRAAAKAKPAELSPERKAEIARQVRAKLRAKGLAK